MAFNSLKGTSSTYQCQIYQARAERGLLTNKEGNILSPSSSIGAPNMYILEKMHFMDPNIDARIFFENLKDYQTQFFYVLHFSLCYLKTAQKAVQRSKNAKNYQIVIPTF